MFLNVNNLLELEFKSHMPEVISKKISHKALGILFKKGIVFFICIFGLT